MPGTQQGGCQCGAVRYRFSAAPLTLYLCHCTECQKQSSSAFGMSLWLRREDLEFTSGELKFWQRGTDSGGTTHCAFCPTCGTRLYHASSSTAVRETPFGVFETGAGGARRRP